MLVVRATETSYLVPRKRFKWNQVHFIRHFVPRKRFKWNQVSSMMCFVPRKRFRRNKSRNRAVPRGGGHPDLCRFPFSNIEVFRSPRWPISTHQSQPTPFTTSSRFRSPRRREETIWRSSPTPMAGRGHAPFRETLTFNQLQNSAWKRSQK